MRCPAVPNVPLPSMLVAAASASSSAQTRNTFENLRRVLREAGADMKDVVKLNTYYQFDGEGPEITDFWEQMTKVRMQLSRGRRSVTLIGNGVGFAGSICVGGF